MKKNLLKGNKMKSILFILIACIFTQSEQPYPPLDLVSVPTSGTLPRGSYTYETYLSKIYPIALF